MAEQDEDENGLGDSAARVIIEKNRNARLARNVQETQVELTEINSRCLLYTSPSPRDATLSRMPSSA